MQMSSREEIFEFLNTSNTIAISDKITRCDSIERYMEMGSDNYKLLDLFFAYGNASFFKEEIKCYFTRLGKVDSKSALGKDSITTGTGGISFDYMIFDNITVYTSIELFEYIFSMVDFDKETLCYFLRRSIEVQLKEFSSNINKILCGTQHDDRSKNTALLVDFFINQLSSLDK
jgi:hypothetical protein